LAPAIAKTRSLVERESFIAKLARQLAVSPATIYGDLKQGGPHRAKPSAAISAAVSLEEPLAAKARGTLSQIWRFAVADKDLFQRARVELGEEFCVSLEQKELLALIESLGDGYDFQPALLLNYIPVENEGLRQYLLKLLHINVSEAEAQKWSTELIPIIHREALQRKIEKVNRALIQAGETEEIRRLLQEKMALNERLQTLKG
jgi:hypothetical protein